MRLGDLDALKEQFTEGAYTVKGVREVIDNAPTVEIATKLQPNCNQIATKGEWIECTKSGMPLTEYGRMIGEKWYGFKCSQCNFIYKGNALIESPFCQKCGAKMKKGGDGE